nr:rrna-processing protein efg1 [Quercus suber]
MALKRLAVSVHPSRSGQVPLEPSRKKRKINPYAASKPGQAKTNSKSFKKAHPTNELKSQIRSLTRLLEHNEDLPATVRAEKERALQTAERELEQTVKAQKRSDIISRWHKVRFFDRQKATKRLKKAQKSLQAVAESEGHVTKAGLAEAIQEWEIAVNYAMYYPLDVAYVPLFPTRKGEAKKPDAEDAVPAEGERQGDPDMWKKVEQCMGNGTLQALRDGTLSGEGKNAVPGAREDVQAKEKVKVKARKNSDREDKGTKSKAFEQETDEDSEGANADTLPIRTQLNSIHHNDFLCCDIMPTHRGITIRLQSQFDARMIPERQPSREEQSSPDAGNTIHTEIPCYPGSRFWIVYSCPPPVPAHLYSTNTAFEDHPPRNDLNHEVDGQQIKYYFFKLHVMSSSESIISWGVGAEQEWQGKVGHGFFSAGKDFRGHEIVEKRGIFFPGRKERAPAAEEYTKEHDGSFKLEVFRAKGFRKPGDPRRMYTYALLDPLDAPFVVFRYTIVPDWEPSHDRRCSGESVSTDGIEYVDEIDMRPEQRAALGRVPLESRRHLETFPTPSLGEISPQMEQVEELGDQAEYSANTLSLSRPFALCGAGQVLDSLLRRTISVGSHDSTNS